MKRMGMEYLTLVTILFHAQRMRDNKLWKNNIISHKNKSNNTFNK